MDPCPRVVPGTVSSDTSVLGLAFGTLSREMHMFPGQPQRPPPSLPLGVACRNPGLTLRRSTPWGPVGRDAVGTTEPGPRGCSWACPVGWDLPGWPREGGVGVARVSCLLWRRRCAHSRARAVRGLQPGGGLGGRAWPARGQCLVPEASRGVVWGPQTTTVTATTVYVAPGHAVGGTSHTASPYGANTGRRRCFGVTIVWVTK